VGLEKCGGAMEEEEEEEGMGEGSRMPSGF
jgi:hypothetical protein